MKKLLATNRSEIAICIFRAPADGIVNEVLIQIGDTVQSKDLLLRLRAK